MKKPSAVIINKEKILPAHASVESDEGALIMAETTTIIKVITRYLGRPPTDKEKKRLKQRFKQGILNEYQLVYRRVVLGKITRHMQNGTEKAHITFEPDEALT